MAGTSWQGRGEPPHWRSIRANILARDGGRCYYAGCTTPADRVDHIVPRSEGGTEAESNLRASCRQHNHPTYAQGRAKRPAASTLTPNIPPGWPRAASGQPRPRPSSFCRSHDRELIAADRRAFGVCVGRNTFPKG